MRKKFWIGIRDVVAQYLTLKEVGNLVCFGIASGMCKGHSEIVNGKVVLVYPASVHGHQDAA